MGPCIIWGVVSLKDVTSKTGSAVLTSSHSGLVGHLQVFGTLWLMGLGIQSTVFDSSLLQRRIVSLFAFKRATES